MPVDDNEPDLMTDPHTEADLGEGCVPVGRQLRLLLVKSSLPSRKVVRISVIPKIRIIMERSLEFRTRQKSSISKIILQALIVLIKN